jgi:hypothetical protein
MLTSAIFKPGKCMRGLLQMKHPARRALLAVGAVSFLYIVTSAVLAVAGAAPTAPVFFGMDAGNYYFWQMIFVLPLILTVSLLSSGVLFLPGKRKSGGPGFGGTAALAAVTLSALLVVVWVPTAVYAVFMALGMGQGEWVTILSVRGPWQTAFLFWYAGAAIRAVHDFVLAARLVRNRSGMDALLAGAGAAAVAIGAYVVFVR